MDFMAPSRWVYTQPQNLKNMLDPNSTTLCTQAYNYIDSDQEDMHKFQLASAWPQYEVTDIKQTK